ncbi:MAG TPA: PadR family transcriptional regulator [Gemmatimonadales bacterium]|nr:PadR family transcriptional regulator [Gemmatimonadales bacterium]
MARTPIDLLQGTLDVLILKSLSWGPRHGHAVARLIRASTEGAFEVLDGSLYAALHRMEERGWVEAEWGLSDKGKRAKFYQLTPLGRQQLKNETASWQRYSVAVAKLLTATVQP